MNKLFLANKIFFILLLSIPQLLISRTPLFKNISKKHVQKYLDDTYKISSGEHEATLTIDKSGDKIKTIFLAYQKSRPKKGPSTKKILDEKEYPEVKKAKRILFLYWLKDDKDITFNNKEANTYLLKLLHESKTQPYRVHKRAFKNFCDVAIHTHS